MGESHFWTAVRYVERNPVRAKMVGPAEDYRWSSAAAHCLRREDPLLTDLGSIPPLIADWSTWLADEEDPAELTAIRRNTGTGRPWGDKAFLEKLESRLGRPVTPQKRGRRPRSQSLLSTVWDRQEA